MSLERELSQVVNTKTYVVRTEKVKLPPASLLNQQQELIKNKYIKEEEKDDGTGFVWLKQFIV